MDNENYCIIPKTLHDRDKAEVVKSLYDQLTLEQLTNIKDSLVKAGKIKQINTTT